MWGIVPAAGAGSRIQPLAFSKELLPVGSRIDGETERPRAVSEYLLDRMLRAGADKIGFVIAPGKSDIVQYYGHAFGPASIAYVVQPRPGGLCDALFQMTPFVGPDEPVILGLPDTVWFPDDALCALPADRLALLLFPVQRPELFDAVITSPCGRVREIRVKRTDPGSSWIWGAIRIPGGVLQALYGLWLSRDRRDEYVGTLLNAWIAAGGDAVGVPAGRAYVDVGTLGGYREALSLLDGRAVVQAPSPAGLRAVHGTAAPVLARVVARSGE